MVAFKTLIFTILVPGTVAFGIPWLLLNPPWGLVLLFPSFWLLGFLPLLLGVGLYLWCAAAFTFIGKGTPAPIDAPIFLVKAGPYQWVRNPMYLAVLAMVIGQAILFGVSISKSEKCTVSHGGCPSNVFIWLLRRIESKAFQFEKHVLSCDSPRSKFHRVSSTGSASHFIRLPYTSQV